MDSATIGLFKDILRGVGHNPKEGRKKGGINAHTIIKASENIPCLVRYSEAVRHDHMYIKEGENLPVGSIITFDKAYVDYAQYERFSKADIWYVTRLKENAIEIQIWAAMLANLLITLEKSKIKRKWAFSNLPTKSTLFKSISFE